MDIIQRLRNLKPPATHRCSNERIAFADGHEAAIKQVIEVLKNADADLYDSIQVWSEDVPRYDKNYGDQRLCLCGCPYERHFDSYEDMAPVGCKYCFDDGDGSHGEGSCSGFKQAPEEGDDNAPE